MLGVILVRWRTTVCAGTVEGELHPVRMTWMSPTGLLMLRSNNDWEQDSVSPTHSGLAI
jgi:hypothetical protein